MPPQVRGLGAGVEMVDISEVKINGNHVKGAVLRYLSKFKQKEFCNQIE